MGAVYKAHQCNLNRIVALKVMPQAPDDGSIIHRFQRFKREARSLARLSHPNVVAIYECGLAGNFPYFTMDFVWCCNWLPLCWWERRPWRLDPVLVEKIETVLKLNPSLRISAPSPKLELEFAELVERLLELARQTLSVDAERS